MRVLFLDDQLSRHKYFKLLYPTVNVTYVWTVQEATKALDGDRFDYVSLDHDLDGKTFVPSGPGTGYEVAQYIAKMPAEKRPTKVVMHTYNGKAALLMEEVLKDKGIETKSNPFGYDDYRADLHEFLKNSNVTS